ncbi:MAG: hypothetical protein R2851_14165 [Caldilineaceae bacterium]
MDVDERGHARHGREIRQRIATDDAVGYWIPRRNFIVGHEMRGGGYYPDAQLRLLRRDAARYVAEREVHEIVALTARRGSSTTPSSTSTTPTGPSFTPSSASTPPMKRASCAAAASAPGRTTSSCNLCANSAVASSPCAAAKTGSSAFASPRFLAWYYGFMPYWIMLKGQD